MLNNHRSEPRNSTFLGGRITVGAGRAVLHCLVRDCSAGGARLVLASAHLLPDRVTVEIPRMGLRTPATVAWREGDTCGVSFDNPEDLFTAAGVPLSGPT